MENRHINREEQQCISRCIVSHWGEDADKTPRDEDRDRAYERCLSDCRVCG